MNKSEEDPTPSENLSEVPEEEVSDNPSSDPPPAQLKQDPEDEADEASKKRPAQSPPDVSAPLKKKTPTALQQQIQQQLQEQLQQQLQAAAAKGANITPEQIQAQAAAMVQAAAQAQAVVAAGKNTKPMTSSQIAALSQVQAEAIVQARRLPAAQVPAQVQMQAQALVHAHTQAQIQAGIYKGDDTAAVAAAPAATTESKAPEEPMETQEIVTDVLGTNDNPMLKDCSEDFPSGEEDEVADSNSPAFQEQLKTSLSEFWTTAASQIEALGNSQTEHDFKNHNDLPLARIKRIMKSDEDVRMISAEAPVLFAKACELFILDLSIRAWNYSVLHKRRTLQKEDVKEAIQKTDIFDFLVDCIQ